MAKRNSPNQFCGNWGPSWIGCVASHSHCKVEAPIEPSKMLRKFVDQRIVLIDRIDELNEERESCQKKDTAESWQEYKVHTKSAEALLKVLEGCNLDTKDLTDDKE